MNSFEKSFLNLMQHLSLDRKVYAFVTVYVILALLLSGCGCNAPTECEPITTNMGADLIDKWSLIRTEKSCISDCSTRLIGRGVEGGIRTRYWLLDHEKLEITEITSTIAPLQEEYTMGLSTWDDKYFKISVDSKLDPLESMGRIRVLHRFYLYDPATKKLLPNMFSYSFEADTTLGSQYYKDWKTPNSWLIVFGQLYDENIWPHNQPHKELGDSFTAFQVLTQSDSFSVEPFYPNEYFHTQHSLWYSIDYRDGYTYGSAWTGIDTVTLFREKEGMIDSLPIRLPEELKFEEWMKISLIGSCLQIDRNLGGSLIYNALLDFDSFTLGEFVEMPIVNSAYVFPAECGQAPIDYDLIWKKEDDKFSSTNPYTHRTFVYPPLEDW